jgi:uncharacterized protein with HEPN domain
MSPDRPGNLLHLLNMLESCAKIRGYAANFDDAETFFDAEDQLHYNACLALLLNIGESVGKLSPEILGLFPYVAWERIRGFRNRVAHDYPGLDVFVIFRTISEFIPALEASLYDIVGQEKAGGVFDPEEWAAARNSSFYRHVDFSRWGAY